MTGEEELHNFLLDYFTENNATIIENTGERLKIKLTEKLDEELMNRPFYWHYVKKTGGNPETMTVTYQTGSPQEKEKESSHIHFGSPRLHQIFQSARDQGKWTVLYEEVQPQRQPAALYPWLIMNVKISCQSHQRKDILLSLGLQLIHGQIVNNAMDWTKNLQLITTVSPHSFPMKSLIQVTSGTVRLKNYIREYLEKENKDWVSEANKRMKEECKLLDDYYETGDFLSDEEYAREKQAIISRYSPKIIVETINSGIFYLKNSSK
ncbi:YqhG family protein [Alteribacillus sp. HJP-4]|uniref:YqhG family protein n=1 Tax=Alteribacillus sp. HJP-4 TaxID=2775394 RepID=UPI0035CCE71B